MAALVPIDGLLILLDDPGILARWKEVATLGIFAATWLAPTQSRHDGPRTLPAWVVPLAGLMALGALSFLWTWPIFAIVGLKIDFFYVLVTAAVWRCPLSPVDRDRLITILMAGGLLVAVAGLVQQWMGADRLAELGYDYNTTIRTTGSSVLRSFGTFELPFPYAFYLVLVLAMGVPVALADRDRTRNRLFLALTPMLALAMVAAFVRAAVMALAAAGLYLVLRRYRVVLRVLPALAFGLLLVPAAVWSATVSSSSLVERTDGWTTVWVSLIERPLGAGIGTTGAAADVAEDFVDDQVPETFGLPPELQPYQPDNYYVKRLLELGLPGLGLTVAFLHHVLGSALRARRRAGPADAAFADGAIGVLIGAMIAAVVATYWEIFPLDLYFWILLGALTSIESNGSPAADSPFDRAAAASRPTYASS